MSYERLQVEKKGNLMITYSTLINSADKIKAYDKNFGDDHLCKCGHQYYRHFDTHDDMYPCGCKYCECREFNEKDGK